MDSSKKFFWRLIAAPRDSRLCLPVSFKKNSNWTEANTSSRLITGDGYTSPVSIQAEDGLCYLTNGWSEFKDNYAIGLFTILVFSFFDATKLFVDIYYSDGSPNPINFGQLEIEEHIQLCCEKKKTFCKLIECPEDARLCLPDTFIAECNGYAPSKILLITGDGYPSLVELLSDNGVLYITDGWASFRDQYGIGVCSLIVFNFTDPKKVDVGIFHSNGEADPINYGPYDFEAQIQQQIENKINLVMSSNKRKAGSQGRLSDSTETCVGQSSNFSKAALSGEIVTSPVTELSSPPLTRANNFLQEADLKQLPPICGVHMIGLVKVPSKYMCRPYYIKSNNYQEELNSRVIQTLKKFPSNCGEFGHYELKVPFKSLRGPYYEMELPLDLARAMLNPGRNSITLKIKDKGVWAIICNLTESTCKIENGWHEFAWANELDGTDTLVFSSDSAFENVWSVNKRCKQHRFY